MPRTLVRNNIRNGHRVADLALGMLEELFVMACITIVTSLNAQYPTLWTEPQRFIDEGKCSEARPNDYVVIIFKDSVTEYVAFHGIR